jgi:hypothetical protein
MSDVQHVSTLRGLPEIGREYTVPSVLTDAGNWLPILSKVPHEDGEALRFYTEHFHHDFRFMSNEEIKAMGLAKGWEHIPESFMFLVIPVPQIVEGPVDKPLKCQRQMPEFPDMGIPRTIATFYPNLELKVQRCYRKCPHKGMPLNGVPLVTDERTGQECVVCPAHGLRFPPRTASC